ncbi:hypothetical protein LINPERPRIM_LOCUS10967 [Linum perenne]
MILALLAVEIRPAGFSNQVNLHDSIRRNSRHHYCRRTHHLRRKSLHLCASLSLFRFGFSSAFSPQSPISSVVNSTHQLTFIKTKKLQESSFSRTNTALGLI